MGTLEEVERLSASEGPGISSQSERKSVGRPEGGTADWDDLDWQVLFDERAGILEYDEGLPRVAASRLARQQIDEQRRRSRQ
ncbi:hypothetical protein [Bradyrhizobium stylosanthis]|uniref:hypothetical protein n=1 Tax=Bradyrhizobium stylosanthis TaxID=1803665 RepID=UPI000ADBDE9C|nr:hypothetical protein [Bradyrhizobium stylosanthis]